MSHQSQNIIENANNYIVNLKLNLPKKFSFNPSSYNYILKKNIINNKNYLKILEYADIILNNEFLLDKYYVSHNTDKIFKTISKDLYILNKDKNDYIFYLKQNNFNNTINKFEIL